MTRKISNLFLLLLLCAASARADETPKENPAPTAQTTEFVFDFDAKVSDRVRPLNEVLSEIIRALKIPEPSEKLQRTLIYGTTYAAAAGQPEYSALLQQFIAATGATALAAGAIETLEPLAQNGLRRGVVKINGQNRFEIAAFIAAPKSEKIAIVDLGENPLKPPPFTDFFGDWIQQQGLPPSYVANANGMTWNDLRFSITPETANTKPVLYYYSRLYAHEGSLHNRINNATAWQRVFPNAGITGYLGSTPFGEAISNITAFQKRVLTMPRVDLKAAYSPRDFYALALARAGVRGRETDLDSKIYCDISFPVKENPNAWRKRFYGALANGGKIFDIGDFRPTNLQAPRELRRALDELSSFENIVQDGKLRAAQTALLISETGDIWNNSTAARRALYHAARARQIPLEVVTENEAQKGDLKKYRVLLLADRNISRATARSIVNWVENGGTLIATSGAGMRDELNQKNILLFEQWGIRELEYSQSSATLVPENAARIENAVAMGRIKWEGSVFSIFDARSSFDAGASEVLATFQDGAPALVSRRAGEGMVYYAGFQPPWENEKADSAAFKLMQLVIARVSRPVVCFVAEQEVSSVESNVIQSGGGVVIPIINWRDEPIKKLRVRLPFLAAFKSCRLASGGKVSTAREGIETVVTFDLAAADALIFQ